MTTKPGSRKFLIKRGSGSATPPSQDPPQPEAPPPSADTQPDAAEQEIEAIRREGLTSRQLRMAQRVAQKNGLSPASDLDAVRLLRARGVDPFRRDSMLELVVPPEGDAEAPKPAPQGKPKGKALGRIQLPQTVPASDVAVQEKPGESPAELRNREILQIQRDIRRRRRRKLSLLMVRLAFFVFIPTFAAGYYFYNLAAPMYATTSQFLIIQSEGSGGGASPFGGLLPTQFANSADSIATQAYLQSKDAMQRLDEDAGFRAHFSGDAIDPIQRLGPDATIEDSYSIYKRNVKIGYDPTEGVIRMEVIAADPQVSEQFSRKLLVYAEERVNDLSLQKREDGMRDARTGYEKALENRREAQERLITLQVENGVDPEAVIASIRGQISSYETLLIEKELELAALLDNQRPNQAKVDGAQGDIRRIKEQLDKLNERMTNATEGENSLAQKAVTLQLAQADLASADMILQSAQTTMEQARTEANRQVRYLTIAVEPVAPEKPTYPKKFENTVLAFLIFGGIYLMLSLTASILREQVTS
jgi:capsular polysaccharide transport system permease protein